MRRGSEGNMTKAYNRTDQRIKRKALRNNMPLPETILWTKLKGRQLGGHKFRRQYSVENFVIDFYCPEVKLAVEVDGTEVMKSKDMERQSKIESFGIRFVRFTNKEILENIAGVLVKIMELINQLTSPTPPCQGGE